MTLDVGEGLGLVWGDEVKLKQVVVNLLTNAVKFTPSGGSVAVSAWLEGEDAVVLVRDSGIGIAAEDQTRIFEAFQRGDRRVPPRARAWG